MIKNIIFDLGSVIIDLDPAATTKAFIALGMADFEKHYSTVKQSGVFDAFDKGIVSPEIFRSEMKKYLPANTSDEQVDAAWNAMLLSIPEERLLLLDELKKKYRIFLLSNTNEIHVAAFSTQMKQQHGFSDFSGFFENWYYSCRIGMRKPDKEVFEFVLEQNGLHPEETLFIDDSPQHVEGAKNCGLKTKWLRVQEKEDLCQWWVQKRDE